jgi:hypothetical protein
MRNTHRLFAVLVGTGLVAGCATVGPEVAFSPVEAEEARLELAPVASIAPALAEAYSPGSTILITGTKVITGFSLAAEEIRFAGGCVIEFANYNQDSLSLYAKRFVFLDPANPCTVRRPQGLSGPDGAPGVAGQAGANGSGTGRPGSNGGPGAMGMPGGMFFPPNVLVMTEAVLGPDFTTPLAVAPFRFEFTGVVGGRGGIGGAGGRGGNGVKGRNAKARNGFCRRGNRSGGAGGNAGRGGLGGNGGVGGDGANLIFAGTQQATDALSHSQIDVSGGTGGLGGAGGAAGVPGQGGKPGKNTRPCTPRGRFGPPGKTPDPSSEGAGVPGAPGVTGTVLIEVVESIESLMR